MVEESGRSKAGPVGVVDVVLAALAIAALGLAIAAVAYLARHPMVGEEPTEPPRPVTQVSVRS
ncbi:hypothetical protein [Phytohabitans kaempferiae]|uniref:Uncharacterized protein n=1 Tax=Phytohabitans kaempferiae TaxID=1620943 RepID=A0ABV6M9D1_9ACTN